MTKVRLLVAFANAEQSWQPGDIWELPYEAAQALVERGMAELVEPEQPHPAIERAVRRPPERR